MLQEPPVRARLKPIVANSSPPPRCARRARFAAFNEGIYRGDHVPAWLHNARRAAIRDNGESRLGSLLGVERLLQQLGHLPQNFGKDRTLGLSAENRQQQAGVSIELTLAGSECMRPLDEWH